MSLEFAVLGFLSYGPMSGYDLKKYFDQSVGHFWSATQSHIYKALDASEKKGWTESRVIPQEGKPNRKEYHITDAGQAELLDWLKMPLPLEPVREPWLIQVFFAHNLLNEELVRLFQARAETVRARLAGFHESQEAIDQNAARTGVPRMQALWQITHDYGASYYQFELAWLDKSIEQVKQLPPLARTEKP
jgi:PadR family transcriptional regulator, regulatory protein AphA